MPGASCRCQQPGRLETEFDLAGIIRSIWICRRSSCRGQGVSINLSAQSISTPEIVSLLLELSRHNVRHPLMLEITETSSSRKWPRYAPISTLLRTLITASDGRLRHRLFAAALSGRTCRLTWSVRHFAGEQAGAGRPCRQGGGRFVRMMNDAATFWWPEGCGDGSGAAQGRAPGFRPRSGVLAGAADPCSVSWPLERPQRTTDATSAA